MSAKFILQNACISEYLNKYLPHNLLALLHAHDLRKKHMKSLSYSLLLGCSLAASSFHVSAKTAQLEVHTSSAQPAHLTTRIEWTSYPKLKYNNQDLANQDRAAILRVYSDTDGKVTKATVQESTGLKKLDQMLIQAVESSTVKPYQDEDLTRPVIGYQVFQLNLVDEQDHCLYNFNSRVWQAQNNEEKTKFKYQQQPQLEVQTNDLNDYSRKIQFNFKVNGQGEVKKVRITQGSGVYALDQKVLAAVQTAKVSSKRSAKTLWLWKTKKFKDDIQFNLEQCP